MDFLRPHVSGKDLHDVPSFKAFPTERLLEKHVSGTFFRKERLISDSMEMPRKILFVES